ncbi:hypothetical protein GCM10011487_35230 [Steroidobacter agaridevorans]|uniref:DUF2846 domain-containing protein n=1 Tax=Steroidobacter agaridevorans TaxID=2695856 RepID=A0A829YF17_9GAMM|nr:DUF2846 domain-containing protein [Steroidobacter agaridevorans]GFE81523.1 hypothetical protein GCM10011487_35230 [Steroidobacter agaridevorans]
MKRIRNGLAVVTSLVVLALAGCASTGGSAPEKKSQAPAAPAAAPAPAPAPASAPAANAGSGGTGTIVFFRESKFAGMAISFKVREGQTELGKLSSGSYFVANLPAGAHEFTVHSEAKDVLNIEVDPGETYYIQGSISMGFLAGRPNLAPSDEATFNSMKAKLKDSGAPKAGK